MKHTENDQLPHGKLGFLHFLYGFLLLLVNTTPQKEKKREKA
jgi:hypothetical protein